MRLTGGQIIAEFLVQNQVPYFLGIPGHGNLALVDAFRGREAEIKVIGVKKEMGAVHIADGYYRASGRPLACFTSIGPGAINTAIGLATAYVDSTAVAVFTGDTHTYMEGKGVLQEIERHHSSNFPRIVEPITKRYWHVSRPDQLPFILSDAFRTMLTGRPGPVVIDLPMDVQAESADVTLAAPGQRLPASSSLAADPEAVERAADLLWNAERPHISTGGGITGAEASAELLELAEYIGASVTSTMNGKGVFPEDHELYAWIAGSKGTLCGNHLASKADVLLAVGMRFADESASSYRRGISYTIPPTKLIHVDIDPHEIGKNYPVEVGLVGHAKTLLRQLLEALKSNGPKKDYRQGDYFAEIQKEKQEWSAWLQERRHPELVPVTISGALQQVREFLDRSALVCHSSGNTQAQILQEFPFYEPRTNITTGGFSCMGFSLPAALGAKLAHPQRQVVAILGDGDFLMSMHELATAMEYDIPAVIIVCNNHGWISIQDLQMDAYGEDRAFSCAFTREGETYSADLAAIGAAFGCHAEKIDRVDEVKPALDRAFASGLPAVVEIKTNREYPYTGIPAVGWWDVPIPTYLEERRAKYEAARAEEQLI